MGFYFNFFFLIYLLRKKFLTCMDKAIINDVIKIMILWIYYFEKKELNYNEKDENEEE